MKKQIVIVGITLVLILVGLTGCFGNNDDGCKVDDNSGNGVTIESKFVGEWESEENNLTFYFNSNGSFYISQYQGIWNIEDGQFCITNEDDEKRCYIYELLNNDKTLTLYDDENEPIWVLIKQNSDNGNIGGTIDNIFAGTWRVKETNETFIFNSDGYIYLFGYLGIWNVEDDQLCYTREGYEKECWRFELSNNDKTITFYDDENNPIHIINKQ